MSDDELFALLNAAARRDAPPPTLGARVIDQLAYRRRLELPLQQRRRQRRLRAAAAVASVGIAAGAGVWVLSPDRAPRILPEQAQAKASGAAPREAAMPAASPCRPQAVARGEAPLIDDFEDGDDALHALEHRRGFWRWAREIDAPGTAPALLPVPRPDASATNRLALHVKGGRLYDWGATVEVSFRPPCYDATRYTGLVLSARGPGRIYVSLREVGVIPRFEGGTCERDCYNSHVAKLDLDPNFRRYEVRWADLRQRGLGRPALDASQLHSIAVLIRPEDTPYDVWLDDISFARR